MPRPAALQKYWDEHPDMVKRVGRKAGIPDSTTFPEHASQDEQERWFRRQFLHLAKNETDPKEKAALLRMAYQTLPKRTAGKTAPDATEEHRQLLGKIADAQEKRLGTARERVKEISDGGNTQAG